MSAPARNIVEGSVIEAYEAFRSEGGFATDHLSQLFRREDRLSEAQRGEVASLLYACVRWIRRADFVLGSARDDLPARLRLSAFFEGRGAASPEWIERDAEIDRVADVLERFGLRHSLPDHLAAVFLEEFGDRAAEVMAALNRPAPQTIHARGDRDVIASQLAKEGLSSTPARFSRCGLVIDPPRGLFSTEAFRRGDFEVMDEGSQLIAELVAPPPGGTVIDLCAGAGGKTLAIASLLRGRGRVIALDVVAAKLEELRRRARRAGWSNVRAVVLDHDTAWPEPVAALEGKVDRVLVDVPCSGLGVLRRNPEARWRIAAEFLEELPRTQLAIAKRARSLLAPGGRLIYSTCTLRRAENEDVVRALLSSDPSLERVRVAEIYGRSWADPITDASGFALSIAPHSHGTDGFYAAVLRRRRAE